ncbi:ethanolamine utilization protein EutJ [Piscinibacter defluvii]|uniref:ethanolamine utilization protein EutJ n=1 Tax=Piscinibacter defluvii TaxID=1796922 RepID=UPI000FDDE31F|nr:ethanolamine utilization protein EutJ [Piscinibacter defluvii]
MLSRTRADTGLAHAQRFLDSAAVRLREPSKPKGPLRFGVDLGTATIVIAAVDAQGEPVYWDFVRAQVVRDGVVVDFHGAVQAVRQLKASSESALGTQIEAAATAHPPTVPVSDCRACAFVLQQAGIDCRILVDEVTAANAILQVKDGAVVDVGGGSTGVGVFRGGELATLSDFAGGGHHLDLILAGALKLPVEVAEVHKREHGAEVMQLLRPGIERVAESVRRQCAGQDPGTVYLAGGALQIPGADAVIARYLGWKVQGYEHAELITPFGIALS